MNTIDSTLGRWFFYEMKVFYATASVETRQLLLEWAVCGFVIFETITFILELVQIHDLRKGSTNI